MTNSRATRKRWFGDREEAPCYWCHAPLALEDSTLDHVIGKGEGGGKKHKGKNNVVLSCRKCNRLRGDVQNAHYVKLNIQTLQNKLVKAQAYLVRTQPKSDEAAEEFQERCKIELKEGPAGVIYPAEEVPALPQEGTGAPTS